VQTDTGLTFVIDLTTAKVERIGTSGKPEPFGAAEKPRCESPRKMTNDQAPRTKQIQMAKHEWLNHAAADRSGIGKPACRSRSFEPL
jgi:hypothetical protein